MGVKSVIYKAACGGKMRWGGSEVTGSVSNNAVACPKHCSRGHSEADSSRRAGRGECAECRNKVLVNWGFSNFALVAIPSRHPGVNIEERQIKAEGQQRVPAGWPASRLRGAQARGGESPSPAHKKS